MIVENALILAAGAGTRMGEIGKVLPKVLWPVFECSLLELEVLYAQSLGVKNIFINSHYYTKEILEHVKENPTFKNVTILLEKEPIDIGGAVHKTDHTAMQGWNGYFIFADQCTFEIFLINKTGDRVYRAKPIPLLGEEENTIKSPPVAVKNTADGDIIISTYTGEIYYLSLASLNLSP